ncbi:hypothetical protein ACF1A9_20410 [Streptomyces sp. NPDC014872]|uniref:hypothetical protein n=1 Tax=Streptomyces sp. NPDC014872 TaxID=3364926 RepID=UPI0036F613A6
MLDDESSMLLLRPTNRGAVRSKLFGEFQYPTAPLGAQWDHDELTRALVKLRPPRPRMTVARAVLVDQEQAWRDKYTWTVIAEVPLGEGGAQT